MDTSEFYDFNRDPEFYKKAQKKVRRMRRFYRTLGTFIAISLFLSALNIITDPNEFWAIFPILGLAFVSALGYVRTFGLPFIGALDEEWQERKTFDEMRKIRDANAFQNWVSERKSDQVFDFEEEDKLPDLESYERRKREFRDEF